MHQVQCHGPMKGMQCQYESKPANLNLEDYQKWKEYLMWESLLFFKKPSSAKSIVIYNGLSECFRENWWNHKKNKLTHYDSWRLQYLCHKGDGRQKDYFHNTVHQCYHIHTYKMMHLTAQCTIRTEKLKHSLT